VPQGGVLSPTLFLIYINDATENIGGSVHSSLYADNLALWTSEKHIATASTQMQNALRSLKSWSRKWLLKINEGKTTFTSFSLSNKKQVAKLILNGKGEWRSAFPYGGGWLALVADAEVSDSKTDKDPILPPRGTPGQQNFGHSG
jgi:hypothetical protein